MATSFVTFRRAARTAAVIALLVGEPLAAYAWAQDDAASSDFAFAVRTVDPAASPASQRAPELTEEGDIAVTLLEGVFRYTCDSPNGFLPSHCREELLTSCREAPVVLTTDFFLSLGVSISNAQDGDTWAWNWRRPDGTNSELFGAGVTFHEALNDTQQLCFTTFGLAANVIACGTRALDFEIGHRGIHDSPANYQGVWTVNLSFNDEPGPLYSEPADLYQPPKITFKDFSQQPDLASGILRAQVELTGSAQDSGPWMTLVRVGTDAPPAPPSEDGIEVDLSELGEQPFEIELAEHGIERFEHDAILTIATEVVGACDSIPPSLATTTVAVPLPVVFIHGYIPPSQYFKGGALLAIERQFGGPVIIHEQGTAITDLLIGASTEPNVDKTISDWRVPYQDSTDPYPTFWVELWTNIQDSDPNIVIDRFKHSIENEVLPKVYANRVNLITHSTGGLIGRLLTHEPMSVDGYSAGVDRLIMVASPNHGVGLTYTITSGFTRERINQLLSGVARLLVPETRGYPFDLRGPYRAAKQGNQQCIKLVRPPFERSLISDVPLPAAEVVVTNIYAVTKGADVPWDITAACNTRGLDEETCLDEGWFVFKSRSLSEAKSCPPAAENWARFREGDGTVGVFDAALGLGFNDIELRSGLTHVQLFNDPGVRAAILRALGLSK